MPSSRLVGDGLPRQRRRSDWTEVKRKENQRSNVDSKLAPPLSVLPSVLAIDQLMSEKSLREALEKGTGCAAKFCLAKDLETARRLNAFFPRFAARRRQNGDAPCSE